jgi:hypothetical protein
MHQSNRLKMFQSSPVLLPNDDPVTGKTFIPGFNKSLYYGERLERSLIDPNQVRSLWHSLLG